MKNLKKLFLIITFLIVNCTLIIENACSQWVQTSGPQEEDISSLTVSGSNIFASTWGGGIFLSTNNGGSWTAVNNGLTSTYVSDLAVSGSNIFAGTWYDGIFLSTNNGGSWTAVNNGLTSSSVFSLAVSGSNIFAGTGGGGIFLSTNNGGSWVKKNEGFWNDSMSVGELLITNEFIFAGIDSSVWRRELSEILSVQNISSQIPSSFSLSQNYPNPFNPVTNIRFDIMKAGKVRLSVYDITGKEVSVLTNEVLKPGSYEVGFDASHLSSGVYYYRIEAGEFVSVKRMVLLK